MYKKEPFIVKPVTGQWLTLGAGESFASSQDTAHYSQNNGDEEMVVFIASAGAKGKKTTVPTK
jgi:quercetin dioxygenase-like cupin family protein